ncbi:MAG: YeeE/YedE thiosulfate transporter family protein [Pseudomonadota bacterium]
MRWEACDDARELGRHLAGAFLMGTGGVFALGCTIGQGVSAMSTLSLSAPITMVSIAIGARLGLSFLIEGTFTPIMFRTNTCGKERFPAE